MSRTNGNNRIFRPPSSITLDDRNFLIVDGAKVCKYYPETRTLEFVDTDRRRASKRGTRLVEVSLPDLQQLTRDP